MKNFRKQSQKSVVEKTGKHPWGPSYGYVWAPDGARFCWEAERDKDTRIITVMVTGDRVVYRGPSKKEAKAHLKMWALCMSRDDMSYLYFPREGACESTACE